MKNKKMSKVIFSIVGVLLLLSAMILPTFAVQLGAQRWQAVNDLSSVLPSYAVPSPVGSTFNSYTLVIDLHSLSTYPGDNYSLLNWDIMQRDTNQMFYNYNVKIGVDVNTGNPFVIIRDSSTQSILLEIRDVEDYSNRYLLVPYSTYGGVTYEDVNPYIRIYSNNQYTTAYNDFETMFSDGYNQGSADATNTLEAGKTLISAVVEAPYNVLRQMFNFDVLGVNVFGLLMSIFTLCLIAGVIRFLI